MNTILVFLAAFAVFYVSAAVAPARSLPALLHEETHDQYGQYSLRYITAEGTIVIEKGRLVPNPDGSGHVMVMEGEVIYIGDDGKTYKTVYTAGFDGYRVIGDHIPVAPPVHSLT